MSGFTRGEVEYMREGQLGRLATVDESGRPHVVHDVLRSAGSAPWRARGVEVRGRAEALDGGAGPGSAGGLIRIFPGRIVGWGIDADAPGPNARSVSG